MLTYHKRRSWTHLPPPQMRRHTGSRPESKPSRAHPEIVTQGYEVATRRELDVALGLEFGQATPSPPAAVCASDAPSLVGVERHGMPGTYACRMNRFQLHHGLPSRPLPGLFRPHPSGEFWPHPADRRPGGETSPELGFPPVPAVWRRPQVGQICPDKWGPQSPAKTAAWTWFACSSHPGPRFVAIQLGLGRVGEGVGGRGVKWGRWLAGARFPVVHDSGSTPRSRRVSA